MPKEFLSASDFNRPLDTAGASDPKVLSAAGMFTDFLQTVTKAAFTEPYATRICTTLVELKRMGQEVTDKDIQNIADAVVWGGYGGNIKSGKTIEDIRREMMDESKGCLGALDQMRRFSGEGAEKVGELLAILERNQRPLTIEHLQVLADANQTNRRLCGMLADAAKCFGGRLIAGDALGDVPMTEAASAGKTQITHMVVGMLKLIAKDYGDGPHKAKLETLIKKCETECNTLLDHKSAIDKLTGFGGGLGSGKLNSALKEMSRQLSDVALGAQKGFDADRILVHVVPPSSSVDFKA